MAMATSPSYEKEAVALTKKDPNPGGRKVRIPARKGRWQKKNFHGNPSYPLSTIGYKKEFKGYHPFNPFTLFVSLSLSFIPYLHFSLYYLPLYLFLFFFFVFPFFIFKFASPLFIYNFLPCLHVSFPFKNVSH